MSYSISDHYDRYDEEWMSDRPSKAEAERDDRECGAYVALPSGGYTHVKSLFPASDRSCREYAPNSAEAERDSRDHDFELPFGAEDFKVPGADEQDRPF